MTTGRKSFKLLLRILAIYIFLMTITLLIGIALFYNKYHGDHTLAMKENLKQISRSLSDQIELRLEWMDSLAVQIISNPSTISTMTRINIVENQYEDNIFNSNITYREQMRKILISVSSSKMTPARISIFNHLGDYIDLSMKPAFMSTVSDFNRTRQFRELYNIFYNHEAYMKVIWNHPDYWYNSNNVKMISIFRPIINLETYLIQGVVQVQQPFSMIEDIGLSILDKDMHIYLFDEGGNIIYASHQISKEELNHYFSLKGDPNTVITTINNSATSKMETVATTALTTIRWKIVTVLPVANVTGPLLLLDKIILTVGIVLILITTTIIILMHIQINKPLRQLKRSVSTVNLNNLHIKMDTHTNELASLNNAFISMFERLNNSIVEIDNLHVQTFRAQMLALQAQSSPHFLHNTLTVISSIGQELGEVRIMKMCRTLSNMLLYTTAFTTNGANLREELTHLQNYIYLLQQRYEEQFIYKIIIEAEDHLLDTRIPKLIFQPLIENCFQHGFKKMYPPYIIEVILKSDYHSWTIEIHDNGSGFDPQVEQQLKKKVESYFENPVNEMEKIGIGGLGLHSNVIRMNVFYKKKSIFEIEKSSLGGAKIIMGGKLDDTYPDC
jgi:two-component system sensor histidine kinase YesM